MRGNRVLHRSNRVGDLKGIFRWEISELLLLYRDARVRNRLFPYREVRYSLAIL